MNTITLGWSGGWGYSVSFTANDLYGGCHANLVGPGWAGGWAGGWWWSVMQGCIRGCRSSRVRCVVMVSAHLVDGA